MNIKSFSTLAALTLVTWSPMAASCQAATLDFSLVGPTNAIWGGTTFDPASGSYYRINGFYPTNSCSGSAQCISITAFSNQAGFQANSGGSSVPTIGLAAGTNFAANGGFLYGHLALPDPYAAAIGKWDLATGALVGSATPAGFGGANGPQTFQWGGFSSMNTLQDTTGMYLLSGAPGSGYGSQTLSIGKLGSDLSVANVHTISLTGMPGGNFNGSQLGWGFMINGVFFGGSRYDRPELDYMLNASTGGLAANVITIAGLPPQGGGSYITNANYVSQTDTLYVWDDGNLYEARGAAEALNLAGSVPELSTWALLLLGFASVGFLAHRRNAKPALMVA